MNHARERSRCLSVLGLSANASTEEIKKAYRMLALQNHPDKNKSEKSTEKIQEINAAYDYLTKGHDKFFDEVNLRGFFMNDFITRLFPWFAGDHHYAYYNYDYSEDYYDYSEDTDDSSDHEYSYVFMNTHSHNPRYDSSSRNYNNSCQTNYRESRSPYTRTGETYQSSASQHFRQNSNLEETNKEQDDFYRKRNSRNRRRNRRRKNQTENDTNGCASGASEQTSGASAGSAGQEKTQAKRGNSYSCGQPRKQTKKEMKKEEGRRQREMSEIRVEIEKNLKKEKEKIERKKQAQIEKEMKLQKEKEEEDRKKAEEEKKKQEQLRKEQEEEAKRKREEEEVARAKREQEEKLRLLLSDFDDNNPYIDSHGDFKYSNPELISTVRQDTEQSPTKTEAAGKKDVSTTLNGIDLDKLSELQLENSKSPTKINKKQTGNTKTPTSPNKSGKRKPDVKTTSPFKSKGSFAGTRIFYSKSNGDQMWPNQINKQNVLTNQGTNQKGRARQGTNQNGPTNQGIYQNTHANQGIYQNAPTNQGIYQNTYAKQGIYQNAPTNQGIYQNAYANQGIYQNAYANQGVYENVPTNQGIYQNTYANQGIYQNARTNQGNYHKTQTKQGNYHKTHAKQGAHQKKQYNYPPKKRQTAETFDGNRTSSRRNNSSHNEPSPAANILEKAKSILIPTPDNSDTKPLDLNQCTTNINVAQSTNRDNIYPNASHPPCLEPLRPLNQNFAPFFPKPNVRLRRSSAPRQVTPENNS